MDTAQPEPLHQAREEQASFGALLRQYRLAAGLSQETLAERAGISVQGLSALENGKRHAPYRHTVGLLARALDLSAAEAAALEATVQRGRGMAGAPPPAPVTPAREVVAAPAAEVSARIGPAPEAAALPTGTLTILLTDVESSTPLWEHHPAAMQRAIARHDALMDEVLAQHGGRQVKERGEGDSILAVFTSPSAALAAACALQQALPDEPWPPETPLRVRIGLHTGEAELRGIGYYGVTVNRAARIRSLAHGGQVLLSQATAELVRGALPAGVSLRPLGAHRLKGLDQPEEIYQVVHPELPADFPPLASPVAHPSNLPLSLTSFIGREREQAAVRALLWEARLVTLTGAGGAGKTRLALAVATELLADCPGGVWLVELAPLADPALVPQAVAQPLGLREEAGRPLLGMLLAHLKDRRLLLVLDNCEHLVGACAELATALLRACPLLRILATSREGLGVAGERLYRVPSLAAPPLDPVPPPEELGGYAAVALFVVRAQERRADFALTAQNARAVAAVCARLDGLPLAIELAAARVGSLPVAAIAARLDDRFRLLTGGPRSAMPRQQTLRAALDWSHGLLSEPEQVLFRRLAIFAGGCTLEAAESVYGGAAVAACTVLDLLSGLIAKSLVVPEERDGEGHYRLPETVRQYAHERLAEAGEEQAVRTRHLAYYLALAEEAEPALLGREKARWLARLEPELENLRVALAWSLDRPDLAELGLRLGSALLEFWYDSMRDNEGRRWIARALTATAGLGQTLVHARALNAAARLAGAGFGDLSAARAWQEQGLAMCSALGDRIGEAQARSLLGRLMGEQGDLIRARALLEESLALWRALAATQDVSWPLFRALYDVGYLETRQGNFELAGNYYREAAALCRQLDDTKALARLANMRARIAWLQGKPEEATTLLAEGVALAAMLEDRPDKLPTVQTLGFTAYRFGQSRQAALLLGEGLELARESGDRGLVAWSLNHLADVRRYEGDLVGAATLYDEAMTLFRAEGHRQGVAAVLHNQGHLALAQGEHAQAAALFAESLGLFQQVGYTWSIGDALIGLAGVAAVRGQPRRTALLLGAAAALHDGIDPTGMLKDPCNQRAQEHAQAQAQLQIDSAAWSAAYEAGRLLPVEDAITQARGERA